LSVDWGSDEKILGERAQGKRYQVRRDEGMRLALSRGVLDKSGCLEIGKNWKGTKSIHMAKARTGLTF